MTPWYVSLIDTLGWTVVHSVWQLALIAAVAAALDRALHRHSPVARYAAGLVLLATMVVAPLATWGVMWTNVASTAAAASAAKRPSVDPVSGVAPESAGPVVQTPSEQPAHAISP